MEAEIVKVAEKAVQIRPLGAPELGMTRAEMLEYSSGITEMAISIGETFYTLLFAYVVAMFIAGRLLTRTQYVIATFMYVVVMSLNLFIRYNLSALDQVWSQYAGMQNVFAGMFNTGLLAVGATLVILSIWFGRKIRHPTSELPQ